MITKNIVKHPKSVVDVQITMPWADVETIWNQTLQKLAAEMELPGFRKGQAPLNMVEQNLSTKLQEEVFKTLFPQALIEALKDSDVVPIDYPKYQLVSFIKGGQLAFRAVITERPTVKIGDYKGINVQKPALKEITDEDVNKLVDDLFKRWKAKQPGGQPGPPAGAEGSITFNQPNGGSGLPDDIFAKAMGAQSLLDLKIKIRADLESEAKYNNELDFEEAILQEIEKSTTVEVPDILIDDELNRMLVSLQRRVADMGLLLEDYLKGQNKTVEGLKTEWRPQAERNVRMELGLAEVAKLEKVEITDAELQAEIDKIQDAKLKAQLQNEEPRLHLRHSLRQMRTLDLLKKLVKTS